jgi:hypothetical protein
MKVDLETLKERCRKVTMCQFADPKSNETSESANLLARQLAGFTDKFWYVWVNHGDGVFNATVMSSDELSQLAAQGKQIELKSKPLDSAAEAKLFMDVAIESERQLNAEIAPYKLPPKGKVEWSSGNDGILDVRSDSATPVVDVYWGDQGNPKHTQRFHLDVSPGKRLWVLWQEYVNGSGKSPRHWVIAHMAKRGISTEVAVRKLLTYALEEERDEGMKRFDGVSGLGCISTAEVELIASDVWKEEE